MRVEFEGGPADGLRQEAPDHVTTIFFDDVGPARTGADPFEGKSLGRTSYEITDKRSKDGSIIFRYTGPRPDEPSQR
jgi:hypothetical protein